LPSNRVDEPRNSVGTIERHKSMLVMVISPQVASLGIFKCMVDIVNGLFKPIVAFLSTKALVSQLFEAKYIHKGFPNIGVYIVGNLAMICYIGIQ
jgi:hypothetical protein